MSWEEAEDFCRRSGGKLVSLDDNQFIPMMKFFHAKNLSSDIWIGGTYKNSSWFWSDDQEIVFDEFFWSLT